MLSVYRVGVATQTFQFFETDDENFPESVWSKLHGESASKQWSKPSVYIFRPKNTKGDFIGYLGGRVFAIAESTIAKFPQLQSFFEQCGELLPFRYERKQHYVFNCTNCLNALDQKKSDKGNSSSFLKKYTFLPNRFHFSLFCIPETKELLCVEGLTAPEDEFKGYVEQNDITGLMFEPLWSDRPKASRSKKKK